MPRNSRSKAIAAAREVLASAITSDEKIDPGSTSPVLTRLKALLDRTGKREPNSDDIATVLAFARVSNQLRDPVDQLIPLLVDVAQLQAGERVDAKATLTILANARVAILRVIRAVSLERAFEPSEDWSGTILLLRQLDDKFEARTHRIQAKLETATPSGSRAHAGPLRYLITLIDDYNAHMDQRARSPDIAKLAALALDMIVTDKQVSAMRERK
jgi:hypothetical protein